MAGPAAANGGKGKGSFGAAGKERGSIVLVSNVGDATTANDFSGVMLTAKGVTTFSSLRKLSAKFSTTDDGCAGGSPRFQLAIDGKNLFVYLGPAPSFSACTAGRWERSGNLIGSTEARYDLSQFGGAFYSTYAQALALLGDKTVTGIALIVDGGWAFADKEQTVLIRNVQVKGNARHFKTAGATKTMGVNANVAMACNTQKAALTGPNFKALYGNKDAATAWHTCKAAMSSNILLHDTVMAGIATCAAEVLTSGVTAFTAKYGTTAPLASCVAAGLGVQIQVAEAKSTKNRKGKH
jgi:hypothetical protein